MVQIIYLLVLSLLSYMANALLIHLKKWDQSEMTLKNCYKTKMLTINRFDL